MTFTNLPEDVSSSPIVIVTGPTATGKTRMAVELARAFNGEIISADSRQLYRGMDLGTGKDLEEYGSGANVVPVHLIDILEPSERFDLFRYLEEARIALIDIVRRNRLPILCGGTPLYIAALLDGYAMIGGEPDWKLREELEGKELPELIDMLKNCASDDLLERTDMTHIRRVIRAIEIARHPECNIRARKLENTLILAPKFERSVVRERIAIRLRQRFESGMLDEIRHLHDDKGISWEQMDWFGLEYRFISRHLRGMLSFEEMFQELLNHIRQFAKHQDSWFRKMERDGKNIHWIPGGDLHQAMQLVQEFLSMPNTCKNSVYIYVVPESCFEQKK